ncbi:MAG: glutaredoxin family protein [Actinomycetes bacterium]
MTKVVLYSRSGCHLCDIALETLEKLQSELSEEAPFEIEVLLIDGDPDLEKRFGEQVPVTYIDGSPHDFWRVEPDRFKKALLQRR